MSAAPPQLLALDVGTGSVRAHLLDTEGTRLVSAGRSVPVVLGADARAEIDTDAVWAASCAVLRDVLARTPPSRLAALAVGLWAEVGEAARRGAPPERIFEPDPDRHARFGHLIALRRHTYRGLRDVFPALAKLRCAAAGGRGNGGAEESPIPETPSLPESSRPSGPQPHHPPDPLLHSAPAPLHPGSPAPPLIRTPAARPGSALNVYLCGMIGAGKTAVGERLAARMGRPFFDLDRELDRELGRSFHSLVHEQGWLAFRELEYQLCRRFACQEGVVVALGGGTVRYAWNTDVLRGTGIMILLEADLSVLAQRVRTADRPRVNPGVSLEEDLERIWAGARHLYRGAADLVCRTDVGKTVEAEVEELLGELGGRGIR